MTRIFAATFLALAGVSASHADTLTVCASGCDYTSINAAIADASHGDLIQLAAETYFEGEVIDTLGKGITIRGVAGVDGTPETVISGRDLHRVVECKWSFGETVLEDLVLRQGYASTGGALLIQGAEVAIRGCVFVGNAAGDSGGAIFDDGFSTEIVGCKFESNTAPVGGALYVHPVAQALIGNCEFSLNTGEYGGAAYFALNSWSYLAGCAFEQNVAREGGAIYSDTEGVSVITLCSFFQNLGVDKGGALFIYSFLESPLISQCTFNGNSSERGGGVYCSRARPLLDRCSFASNVAVEGGGFYNMGLPNMTECVFDSNEAEAGGGIFNYAPYWSSLTMCVFEECCQVYPPGSNRDLGGNEYTPWCVDCRADVSCSDQAVDARDLGAVLAVWETDDVQCDINADGRVDAADIGMLIASWGPCR